MNVKNKRVVVKGFVMGRDCYLLPQNFVCIITNDEHGKTLSINNGKIQFTIPFEPIEQYLK